jgi:hypothetical protein
MSKPSGKSDRQGGLERKLAAYAMAGGALVASTAGDATAGIVVETIDQTIGTGQASSYTVSNQDGSIGVVTFSINSTYPPAELDVTQGVIFTEYVGDSSGNPVALPVGYVVGDTLAGGDGYYKSTAAMAQYGTTGSPTGNFAGLTNAYLGVSFYDFDNNVTDYGYVTLSVTGTTGSSPSVTATIENFVYDDSGNPVTIGAVPEPASLTMLAMGATGVGAFLAWRKRRATA